MTKEAIITVPNPLLSERSKRISYIDASVRQLVEDMTTVTLDWERSREHELGAALAAVQIAQAYRVVIVRDDFENRENPTFTAYINPEIVKAEGEPVEDMEGCLSVADIYGKVKRYPKIKMKALDLSGKEIRLTATDFLARVLQHEIDHTNGIVFTDHIKDPDKLYRLEKNGEFTAFQPPKGPARAA